MTSDSARNGTERVAEAVKNAGLTPEIVVNLQGDAPLTPPSFVTTLIAHMRKTPATGIATPILRCDEEAVRNFIADRAAGRALARRPWSRTGWGQALYFSKEVIPFTNGKGVVGGEVPVFHHVGLYAYRPTALAAYGGWEPRPA